MSDARASDRLDALLAESLALPDRTPDAAFAARVDALVAEQQRYARLRSVLLRRVAVEFACLAALAATLLVIAQIPEVRSALSEAPLLAGPAMLSLVLLWLATRRGHARLA